MLLHLIEILKTFMLFTTSYSNSVFKEPLSKEEEEKYIEDGIIWYFDVAEMTNEDILRTMWQFKNVGWFISCKGILFGRIENEINYTGIALKDAVNYNLLDLNVPIFINTDIGHTDPVYTIINGSIVRVTKDKNNKHIMETTFE